MVLVSINRQQVSQFCSENLSLALEKQLSPIINSNEPVEYPKLVSLKRFLI